MNHQEELIKFVSEIEDGVFFIDQKGFLTFCNEGWEEITCFSKSELFSKNWIDLFHKDDLEQATELSKSLHESKKLDLFVLRIITNNSAVRYVQFFSSAIFKNNKYIGSRFIARDVSLREFSNNFRKAEHDLMQEIALGSTHSQLNESVGNYLTNLYESQFVDHSNTGFVFLSFEINPEKKKFPHIYSRSSNYRFKKAN